MKNRLKLDFSLETAEQRKEFVDNYIDEIEDITPQEAETIANYLLQRLAQNIGLKVDRIYGDVEYYDPDDADID